MKKIDLILIAVAFCMAATAIVKFLSGIWILKLLVGMVTLVVLLYWKLAPYKSQLSPKYLQCFNQVEKCIKPVWGLFKNVPMIQLGNRLLMEAAPFIICSVLIILLIIL